MSREEAKRRKNDRRGLTLLSLQFLGVHVAGVGLDVPDHRAVLVHGLHRGIDHDSLLASLAGF
jgi:hypothetical protein